VLSLLVHIEHVYREIVVEKTAEINGKKENAILRGRAQGSRK